MQQWVNTLNQRAHYAIKDHNNGILLLSTHLNFSSLL